MYSQKWSLGLLLKLLELLLEEKVLVSFSQWKWRCFGFTCLVRCCCWSCHSCVGTFLLARNERRNDVWHLLELLEGWSTIVRIYAGIALWPVTALMRRASIFSSPRAVTVVALMEWLVKCGEMPALDVIFFIISPRGLSPSGELQNHNCVNFRIELSCTERSRLLVEIVGVRI